MVAKNLTNQVIKRLKPPEKGRISLSDTQVRGLELRCTAGGVKSFAVQYGKKNKRRRKTLGQYPVMSLAEAREMAKAFLHEKTIAPLRPASPSYDVALERFLRLKEPELRRSSFREYKRLLNRHFPFETELIEDISSTQIVNAIDAIEAPSERTHAYTAVKTFFNWCVEREYCAGNPLANMRKPKVNLSEKRVLDERELRLIWDAAFKLRRFGEIVRLLMITGQRAGQIAGMHESWIDYDQWLVNFPASVMKNKQPHTIPIGSLFKTALVRNKPVDGWLFAPPGMPGVPFSVWSKRKAALDDMLPQMEPWKIHDLRRSWSTIAAKKGIPPHITGRILSHNTSAMSEIDLIYNQHHYLDEMRAAMDMMESHFKVEFDLVRRKRT